MKIWRMSRLHSTFMDSFNKNDDCDLLLGDLIKIFNVMILKFGASLLLSILGLDFCPTIEIELISLSHVVSLLRLLLCS